MQVYVLLLIPDTPIVEGKAVGFLSVNIDPIPSLKQAYRIYSKHIFRFRLRSGFWDFNLLLRSWPDCWLREDRPRGERLEPKKTKPKNVALNILKKKKDLNEYHREVNL